MLMLKDYQRDVLNELAAFCQQIDADGLYEAYRTAAKQEYSAVPQLPDVPYVCVRVPTGGGKTLLGAHAMCVIARNSIARILFACGSRRILSFGIKLFGVCRI